MAVRKQRRMKTLKGRTVVVKNRSHWDKLLEATMDGKLLIVHYSAVSGAAVCQSHSLSRCAPLCENSSEPVYGC